MNPLAIIGIALGVGLIAYALSLRDDQDDVLLAETWSMVAHQAAGMASAQLDTPISTALARMRAIAFLEDISIHQLATEIVGGQRRLEKEI